MKKTDWHGVLPAITTPFREDLSIDFDFLRRHVSWLDRKRVPGRRGARIARRIGDARVRRESQILKACRRAAGDRFVVAGSRGPVDLRWWLSPRRRSPPDATA